MIEIINWQSFQSYKDRRPPWVRLHRSLLDNFEYQSMSADARALLPMLWLLASEDTDPLSGCVRLTNEKISFRLRTSKETVIKSLLEIKEAGFILIKQSCIESVTKELRDSYETVPPETETETETEKRQRRVIPTTTEIVLNDRSNSETMMRNCFEFHYLKLESLYPHANLPAEMETCIAHYAKHPVLDPYPVILKWLNRVPKGKTLALVSSYDQKRTDRLAANAEACRQFAGGE